MKASNFSAGVLCIVSVTLLTYARGQEASCRSPLGDTGTCRSLKDCPEVVSFFQKIEVDLAKRYAADLQKVCGNRRNADNFPVVCCHQAPPPVAVRPIAAQRPAAAPPSAPVRAGAVDSSDRRLPTEAEGCGVNKNMHRIVGGEEAERGTWPWMALIGYNPHAANPFKCGGTLLTKRHVMTAAHCLRNDLSFVRLGEHDLRDTNAPNRVDINVAKTIRHPNYNSKIGRSDIALLVLEKKVEFTAYIYPICTPFSSLLRDKPYLNSMPFVAGWGRTNFSGAASPVLKQLQITIIDNAECRRVYRANRRYFSEEQFDDSVFCASYLGSDGAGDSCQGDSGGPLMISDFYESKQRFYLIGIVAYGIGCAEAGIPSVYTRVQYFRDWINQQIAAS